MGASFTSGCGNVNTLFIYILFVFIKLLKFCRTRPYLRQIGLAHSIHISDLTMMLNMKGGDWTGTEGGEERGGTAKGEEGVV